MIQSQGHVIALHVDHHVIVLHSTFGVQALMGDLFSKRETWFAAEEFLHSVSPMVPISMSYSASSISDLNSPNLKQNHKDRLNLPNQVQGLYIRVCPPQASPHPRWLPGFLYGTTKSLGWPKAIRSRLQVTRYLNVDPIVSSSYLQFKIGF